MSLGASWWRSLLVAVRLGRLGDLRAMVAHGLADVLELVEQQVKGGLREVRLNLARLRHRLRHRRHRRLLYVRAYVQYFEQRELTFT